MKELDAVVQVRVEEAADLSFLLFDDGIRLFYLVFELTLEDLALPLHDQVCVLA